MNLFRTSPPFSLGGLSFSPLNKPKLKCSFSLPRKQFRVHSSRLSVEEISELVHNKALVAAVVASGIGQIAKPFTAAIANRKPVDWRIAIRSGGMPSTHAASVVAIATSLGLERGFSDSVFAMSLVFAGIVMFDAQGVRKEVGYHAKALNKITALRQGSSVRYLDREDSAKAKSGIKRIDNSESISKLLPLNDSATRMSTVTAKKLDTISGVDTSSIDPIEMAALNCEALNESVGHTRVQVLFGALLGLAMGFVIDAAL